MESVFDYTYHINIQIGNKRDVILVDCMDDYGCVSVWLASDPRIQGDGDTFEQAIDKLFHNIDFTREMYKISEELQRIKGTESWYNNPIAIL